MSHSPKLLVLMNIDHPSTLVDSVPAFSIEPNAFPKFNNCSLMAV